MSLAWCGCCARSHGINQELVFKREGTTDELRKLPVCVIHAPLPNGANAVIMHPGEKKHWWKNSRTLVSWMNVRNGDQRYFTRMGLARAFLKNFPSPRTCGGRNAAPLTVALFSCLGFQPIRDHSELRMSTSAACLIVSRVRARIDVCDRYIMVEQEGRAPARKTGVSK